MNVKIIRSWASLLLMVATCSVSAEELFGVPIYPGATIEPAVAEMLKTMGGGVAYRSKDSVANISAFYAKQQGMTVYYSGEKRAIYWRCLKEADCDRTITINNPWLHPANDKKMFDTLITIRKSGKSAD